MNTRAMGRKPDRPEIRQRWAHTRDYLARRLAGRVKLDESTVLQPQGYLMDQKALPSCVGKSFQGRISGLLEQDSSGVELWIGCRAFDDTLQDATQGTTAESAIEILTSTGWIPRVDPNEDSTSPFAKRLVQLPDLDDIMAGFDNTVLKNHEVFNGTDDEKHIAILSALREKDATGMFRNALVFGTGVFSSYFSPPANEVLDETYLAADGDQGGHEQGLIGWSVERNAYVVAGSWNDWTECTILVNGEPVTLVGCCLVSRGVVEHAWDVDKLQLR